MGNKDMRGTGSNRTGGTHRMNYENMSRDELVSYLGSDIDPNLDRDALVAMAIERDRTQQAM